MITSPCNVYPLTPYSYIVKVIEKQCVYVSDGARTRDLRHSGKKYMTISLRPKLLGERGGLVVNASDSGSRGRGFEPHSGQTVLCP